MGRTMFDPSENPQLSRDLKSLHHTPRVPEAVDAAILRELARHAHRRRWRIQVAAAVSVVAAAAMIVLAIFLLPGSSDRPTLAADIDRSGQVDVVDALQLAQRVRDQSTRSSDDINRDGVVNQQDVDAIAHLAVKLPVEGSQ